METKCVFVFYPSPFAPINVLHAQMFEGEYVCTISGWRTGNIYEEPDQPVFNAHGFQAGFTQLGRDTATARTSLPIMLAWQTVSSAVALIVSSSSLNVSPSPGAVA